MDQHHKVQLLLMAVFVAGVVGLLVGYGLKFGWLAVSGSVVALVAITAGYVKMFPRE